MTPPKTNGGVHQTVDRATDWGVSRAVSRAAGEVVFLAVYGDMQLVVDRTTSRTVSWAVGWVASEGALQ